MKEFGALRVATAGPIVWDNLCEIFLLALITLGVALLL